MKSLRCPISRQARLTLRGVRNDSRLSSHRYGGWVDIWQSVCDASTVVGLQLGPKFLASLIQNILGIVFELSSQSFLPFFCVHMPKKEKAGTKTGPVWDGKRSFGSLTCIIGSGAKTLKNVKSRFSYLMRIRCDYERMWKHEKFKLNLKLHSCTHLEILKSVEQTWQHTLKS